MKTPWIENYWKHLPNREDGCWEWVGCRHRWGYGRFNRKGEVLYAHRLAYEIANGPIPPGAHICHHCDNPPCCNPAHLFLGDAAANARDKAAKGRTVNPLTDELKTRTHCPRGHPYDEVNTLHRVGPTGHKFRACRACLRMWRDRGIARQRAKTAHTATPGSRHDRITD